MHTLTDEEWTQLNTAYQFLYRIVDRRSTMQDYFDDQREYLNIERWYCLLDGKPFDPRDWTDDNSLYDEEEP